MFLAKLKKIWLNALRQFGESPNVNFTFSDNFGTELVTE